MLPVLTDHVTAEEKLPVPVTTDVHCEDWLIGIDAGEHELLTSGQVPPLEQTRRL
jgi:hypothetical protein